MSQWHPKQFAKDLNAGVYDGRLNAELDKLSAEQLKQLVRAMSELQTSERQPDAAPET